MAEYIEREALRQSLLIGAEYLDEDTMMTVVNVLDCFPAADVAPVVHGLWVQVICHVEFEDGFVDRLYECCSRCHEPNGRKTSDYCPNCGARMTDGE